MQDVFAYCAELVRSADRDRFIASLFAPADVRGSLQALYAFNVEVARVRDVAHQALAGEIRLQWWSEVLQGERAEEAAANPVAAALLATITRRRLPAAILLDLIEAHRFDLYDEPMARMNDLEDYAQKTSSALFAAAATLLAGSGFEAVTRPAGIAHAIAGLLRSFPQHVARGQLYLPLELLARHNVPTHDVFAGRASPGLEAAAAELRNMARRCLDAARRHMAILPGEALPALLPLAVVGLSLKRLDHGSALAPGEVPAWRRQWLIWRASRNPARIAA